MALGFSIKEITNTIHLSRRTIETHIKALKLKLQLGSLSNTSNMAFVKAVSLILLPNYP